MKKRRQRKYLFMGVLMMTIGFASITTTLVMNGTLQLFGDVESFEGDIVFTRAETEAGGITSILEDGKKIIFTSKELSKINDTTTLNFEITNKNRQYDAVATINCNTHTGEYADYVTVVPNKTIYEVNASETVSGSLNATLVKAIAQVEEIDVAFTCTLNVSAKERESVGPKYSIVKKISGDGTSFGDELAIGDEHFYVLSNDEENVRMLAKYNLYVGGYATGFNDSRIQFHPYKQATGMQDKKMLGENSVLELDMAEGVTAFSETSVEYTGSLAEKYVNEYVQKLEEKYAIQVSGDLIEKEEIDAIGETTFKLEDSLSENGKVPSWLYSTAYWTKTAYDATYLWAVSFAYIGGGINDSTYGSFYSHERILGIRPIITIPKSLLD